MVRKQLGTVSNSIVLFDSTSKLDDLEKILDENLTIISFDYESHELLAKNKIAHEISDSFVSRNELINIQNICYGYVKWFENDEFKKLLDYDGINLGLLIQVELNYFLVSFVKKFFEVTNIFRQNKLANFFASPILSEFIKSYTNSVTKLNSRENTQVFYYDTLKIPLKIGKHDFIVQMSKNQFDMLKKIFDALVSALLGPRRLDNGKKTTLIVEFNPLHYKKLIENLSNVPLNLMIFNRRKPIIWNFKSFSIVKRSGCGVITTNSILDNTVKKRIKERLPEINTRIQSLWTYDDFFKSFFSINGVSFWESFKPIFTNLFTKRAFESVSEIEMAKRIFEKYSLNSILVWSEIGSTEQILVKLAKRFGIKVVLLQHGLFYDSESESAYNMNKFQGVYPIDADKYVVWGKIEEKHQIKQGTPNEKLMVLGTPLYDEIVDTATKNDLGSYILLATSGPVKENAFDLTIETIEKNRQTIKKICEVVSKMNKKLVVKLHPSQDEFDPSDLTKEINSNIVVKKTGSISQLAKSCDIFIMIDASTAILDAHLLMKPVISVLVKDSDYGIPSVLSQSCLLTDVDNFETTLQKVLTDENLRKSMIEKGTAYTKEYLMNQGSASTELLKFLSDI